MGGLSTSETTIFQNKIKKDAEDKFNNKINDLPESKQDDEEIELEKEKSKALNILAKIVPAAEVFFRPNNDGKKVSIKSKFTLFT